MKRFKGRGLILAVAMDEEVRLAVQTLLDAGLPVTLICTNDSGSERLGGLTSIVPVKWRGNFSEALNTGLSTIEPGEWLFRMDTDELAPKDLALRLEEALAHAEELNTDALVVPVVEWREDSYRAICPIRLWRHSDSRRYRGAASEVIYDLPTGFPLHRAFYPLAPGGLTLSHSPYRSRDWQRALRRSWIRSDPHSRARAEVLELNEAVGSRSPRWRDDLRAFFTGPTSTIAAKMLNGGSLSFILLADYIFSISQETLMRDSTIRLVEICLGLFGWSPLVLFIALRVLAVSDFEGPWLQMAQEIRDEMRATKPIFHSLDSAEMQATLDDFLEVIKKDSADFTWLEYRSPIRMAAAFQRFVGQWDRLEGAGLPG